VDGILPAIHPAVMANNGLLFFFFFFAVDVMMKDKRGPLHRVLHSWLSSPKRITGRAQSTEQKSSDDVTKDLNI
jgi:hypothetical protein